MATEQDFHLKQPMDMAILAWIQSMLYKHNCMKVLTVLPHPNADDWIGDLLSEAGVYDVSYTSTDLLGNCTGYDAVIASGLLQRLPAIDSGKTIESLVATVKPFGLVLITLYNQMHTDSNVLWTVDGKKFEKAYGSRNNYLATTIDVKGYNNHPSVYEISWTV